MSTAPAAAVARQTARVPTRDDPFYIHTPPPVETVIWSKNDNAWVWISRPLGKMDRFWKMLDVTVTAGISERDPHINQKGERVRLFLVYDSPEGIGMDSIIVASSHKSIYSEPRRQTYNLAGVTGMDAGRKCRFYIASPGPFVVNRIGGQFMVTPEYVAKWRAENPDAGSMTDPDRYETFYRNPQEDKLVTEKKSRAEFPFEGKFEDNPHEEV